jgi:hypothetical protein
MASGQRLYRIGGGEGSSDETSRRSFRPGQEQCPRNRVKSKTALIRRWLARRPRFRVHFTPTSASWLNLVERWFAALTQKQIKRGAHQSTRALETAIRQYIAVTKWESINNMCNVRLAGGVDG